MTEPKFLHEFAVVVGAIDMHRAVQPVCKNCKFWERVSLSSGYCKNEKVELAMFPNFDTVNEDFGCIHFEAKPPE